MPKVRYFDDPTQDSKTDSQSNEHKRRMPSWVHWAVGSLLLVIVMVVIFARAAAAQSGAWAEIMSEGKEDFEETCAVCHGKDGKGGGEFGQKLFKKPRDLTIISQSNDGVFPFRRVFDIIAGQQPVPGHDTIHMPKYASRLRGDDFKPGYNPAHIRILELTHYLESIQSK